MSILVLLVLPFIHNTYIRSATFKPLTKAIVFGFIGVVVLLGFLGGKPVEQPYLGISQIATVAYFAFFLVLAVIERFETLFLSYLKKSDENQCSGYLLKNITLNYVQKRMHQDIIRRVRKRQLLYFIAIIKCFLLLIGVVYFTKLVYHGFEICCYYMVSCLWQSEHRYLLLGCFLSIMLSLNLITEGLIYIFSLVFPQSYKKVLHKCNICREAYLHWLIRFEKNIFFKQLLEIFLTAQLKYTYLCVIKKTPTLGETIYMYLFYAPAIILMCLPFVLIMFFNRDAHDSLFILALYIVYVIVGKSYYKMHLYNANLSMATVLATRDQIQRVVKGLKFNNTRLDLSRFKTKYSFDTEEQLIFYLYPKKYSEIELKYKRGLIEILTIRSKSNREKRRK